MKRWLVLGLCLSALGSAMAAPTYSELEAKARSQNLDLDQLLNEYGLDAEYAGDDQELYIRLKQAGEPIPAWLDASINPAGNGARVGGDTPAEAVVIGSFPFADTGSTTGMANDVGPYDNSTVICPWLGYYSAASTGNGPDVFYSFSLAAPSVMEFSLCGSSYDTGIGIFADVAGELGDLVAGNDDSCGLQSYVLCELPAGDYFIAVDGFGTSSGNYTLNVAADVEDPCDAYTAAITAVTIPSTILGDNTGAPHVLYGLGGDVGYEFSTAGGNYTINACMPGTTWGVDLYLFNGNPCDGGTLVTSNTFYSCAPYNPGRIYEVQLAAGDYHLMVSQSSGTSAGGFEIDFIENDDPCEVYTLAITDITAPDTVTGTTVGGPNVYAGASGDVGFNVTIPADGFYDFDACMPGTNYAADLYLFDASPCDGGVLLVSNTFSGLCAAPSGTAQIFAYSLVAGDYHLLVGHTSTTEGAFEVLIQETPPAPTSGGPDTFGYTWINSDDPEGPTFGWVDISATGTPVTLTDDSATPAISMGISFPFYFNVYNDIYIGSNGLLSFNPSPTSLSNQNFPNPSTPNNVIAPFWDDLNPSQSGYPGQIWYEHDAVNDRFIVQYNVVAYGGTVFLQFQAILQADGDMLLQLLNVDEADAVNATVGIENADGSDGLTATYLTTGALLHDELAFYFARPEGDVVGPAILHDPLGDTEQTVGVYTVNAEISDDDSGVAGASVWYQVDGGGYSELPMSEVLLTWTAGIPAQDEGSFVQYYIEAVDNASNTTTSATWGFDVFGLSWPPQNFAASDGLLDQTLLSWTAPTAPPDPSVFFEGFEAGIPVSWTIHNVNGGNAWVQYTFDAYEGAACAAVTYQVPNDDWLVTPAIAVTADSDLSFWVKAGSASYLNEELKVYISTTDTEIASFTDLLLDLAVDQNAWVLQGASLAAYAGQSIHIGFHCTSDNQLRLQLDNVRVDDLDQPLLAAVAIPGEPSLDDVPFKVGVEISKDEAAQLLAQMIAERQAASRAFQTYNVYRDGLLVGTTTALNFADGLANGAVRDQVYEYHVTAQWDLGESDPSNSDTGFYSGRPTSGGPDVFGYVWVNSEDEAGPSFDWIDIRLDPNAVALAPLSDDGFIADIPMGITFPFYGADQTVVNVAMNGFINFGTGSGSLSNQLFPSPSTPNNTIAVFWDDLDPGDGVGEIHTLSDPANDRFIVQYTDVPDYPGPSSPPNTFQAILNGDGSIVIQLADIQGDRSSATLGIENADGTDGLSANYNDTGGTLVSGTAYLFYVPGGEECPAPENLAVSVVSGHAQLSWDAVAGASDYQVWVAEDGYGSYSVLAASTGGTTSYTHLNAVPLGKRFYKVVAVCPGDEYQAR
jgi:hypothetical protein